MFQYPLPSLSHVGIVTRNNSENNPTTNSSFGHILSEYTQGRYESNEKNSYNSQHYCEVCNKYFPNNSSLTSHLQTHEKCTFSDCEFEGQCGLVIQLIFQYNFLIVIICTGTKKLVAAHHHSVHGEYSGKGYKQINVEGQTFCVLLGTDPEEVKDWRNDRKKRFPTAANISKKVEESSLLRKSGGLLTSYQKKVSATETEANETHQKDGKISSRKITKNEIICKFFAKSRRCNSGANCKFSHDLRSKPCNSFTTQGHCSKGDKCCFLHNSFECVVKEDTVATGSEIASPPTPYVCAVGPDERAVDSGMTSPCVETQVPLELCIAPNETDISMTATQAATLSAASSQPLKRNATNMGANQPHLKKSRKMPKQNEPKLQKLFSENLLKKLLNDSILEEENLALQCIHYLVNSCMPQSE